MQRVRREWTVQLEERGGREREREKETDGQREKEREGMQEEENLDGWWVGIRVQRYKAPVIYFGLPRPEPIPHVLSFSLFLSRVRSLLKVFRRASNEAAGTNKPGHLRVNE